MKFCPDDCPHLSLREDEQEETGSDIPHICNMYDKRLYHEGCHPYLIRLNQCELDD